jgi:putative DNA primase/helicase
MSAPIKNPVQDKNRTLLFEEPEPWPEPVNGRELLDELRELYGKYLVLPAGADVANALWTMHTYVLDAASVSPILAVTAPEKRSGKTTVLELHQALNHRALPTSNITSASLFRTVEAHAPTLLIDEAETFIRGNDELRGIVNSGHRRATAQIVRCVGENHEPKRFSTWCPKAIALNGGLPGTIEDRSIVIKMRRRTRDEHVSRFRFEAVHKATADLRRILARWAQDNLTALTHAEPAMPESLNDRAADCWRPLVAIADLARGEWPSLARKAAITLSGDKEDASIGTMLLADIRVIFKDKDTLPSEDILNALNEMEDRPWPEWKNGHPMTTVQLARRLKEFGITPKNIRFGVEVLRGYDREQFEDSWKRYLPPDTSTSPLFQGATTLQPAPDVGFDVAFRENQPATQALQRTSETLQSGVADSQQGCSG